ncbi:MAG: arsenic efflux protein [Oscillospiraceae bacterium]|nr:arsenic efflux protein [Oscillospiraceae bacterium]
MHEFLHILEHSVLDTLKLLPFLLLTYLFMEYLEHKMSDKAASVINRAGNLGPVLGGVLGIVPQCGFSAAMSNLFAGGLITRGTLLAVFLSTSDEMLPILISRQVPAALILKILAVKVVTAVIAGLLVDLLFTKHRHADIHDLCEDENCHCEHGIFLSALKHTGQILLFVFLVNFALTAVIEYIGEDSLANFIMNKPVIGELLSGIIGLIPNCASSIAITELYLQGGMSTGAMLSGLMTGSGVGLLILFRTNKNPRENFKILAMLYGSGVVYGFLAGLLPIF